jgi:sulfite reductase beta subunit-like hemoprotein
MRRGSIVGIHLQMHMRAAGIPCHSYHSHGSPRGHTLAFLHQSDIKMSVDGVHHGAIRKMMFNDHMKTHGCIASHCLHSAPCNSPDGCTASELQIHSRMYCLKFPAIQIIRAEEARGVEKLSSDCGHALCRIIIRQVIQGNCEA